MPQQDEGAAAEEEEEEEEIERLVPVALPLPLPLSLPRCPDTDTDSLDTGAAAGEEEEVAFIVKKTIQGEIFIQCQERKRDKTTTPKAMMILTVMPLCCFNERHLSYNFS